MNEENKLVLILKIISSFLASAAAICAILTYFNIYIPLKNKTNEEEPIIFETSTENIDFTMNDTTNKSKKEILINVEDEVKNIKNKYNSFQEEDIYPTENAINSNILMYYKNDIIVAIKVLKGYDEIGYTRIYYFDENMKLYFAFLYNDDNKYRIYFKDDIVIRYIENTTVYDLYDNLWRCEWEQFVLKESYSFLKVNGR